MERGRQILRQWTIIRLLENQRYGLTVQQIYERLEDAADIRTVYRDLKQLEDVGFPLEKADDGRRRLVLDQHKRWSLPISLSQVLALHLASDFLKPTDDSWLAEPIQEIVNQLEAHLPLKHRESCQELKKQMTVTTATPLHIYPENIKIQQLVHTALSEKRQLKIRYASLKDTKTRVVDPYATWIADGLPYFVAFCHEADNYRTFAMQRIETAELLSSKFDRARDFDLTEFSEKGFGVYHDSPEQIRLHFSKDVAYLPQERRLHNTQSIREHEDGTLEVTMTAGGLPELTAWIVGFGGRVRVLSPQKLKDMVLDRYRAGIKAQEEY